MPSYSACSRRAMPRGPKIAKVHYFGFLKDGDPEV